MRERYEDALGRYSTDNAALKRKVTDLSEQAHEISQAYQAKDKVGGSLFANAREVEDKSCFSQTDCSSVQEHENADETA